jgi:heat shock factor-binding protein 1
MPPSNSHPDVDNAQDLTKLVQSMLTQMQTRFGEMNDNIVGRIDEMGRKIDELEQSIGELVNEAQADQPREGQQNRV